MLFFDDSEGVELPFLNEFFGPGMPDWHAFPATGSPGCEDMKNGLSLDLRFDGSSFPGRNVIQSQVWEWLAWSKIRCGMERRDEKHQEQKIFHGWMATISFRT
jgi:hypothetical protein